MSLKESMHIESLESAPNMEMYINVMHGTFSKKWTYNLHIRGDHYGVYTTLTEDEMHQIAELYERNHTKGEKE